MLVNWAVHLLNWRDNLLWIVVKDGRTLATAQRMFLCGPKSMSCGWDKMYSGSTATIWVISPLLIPLHLVCSDFIHLQIALTRTVLFKWGTNCTLYILCLSTICFLGWMENSKHCSLSNHFKFASSCCFAVFSKKSTNNNNNVIYLKVFLLLNCVSNWKWLGFFLVFSSPQTHTVE